MRFEEKLKTCPPEAIWDEYCGFLDLDIHSYMRIQNRLMEEQIAMWSKSEISRGILRGKKPRTIDEFRNCVDLTTYADYADVLLLKKDSMLPAKAVIWLQTTWEGGKHPIKVAPYTQSMLETFRNNLVACLILATSNERGKFDVSPDYKFLYGLAPLPYATGLFPRALNKEIGIEFLPSVKEAESLDFSERNKLGFKMGLTEGIDYFFGLGSVVYFISKSFSSMAAGTTSSNSSLLKRLRSISPVMTMRYLKAKSACRQEERQMKPKDLFKLRGFMVAGTDNNCYKDELEDMWGIRPMEVFAGTEPTCIGTETWKRDGMYFFPDACFYEFIPEDEMNKNLKDPSYQPKTCLMNEVEAGEKYELVVSVLKGGAFMRYRAGDVYRCIGLESNADKTSIPRFAYIDRVPDIIDIAGFTRISEDAIKNVVELSGLEIQDWVALKEYTTNNKPKMHMYVEMKTSALASNAVSCEILKEHLSIYFKYIDHDYKDLKKILGMDPLDITILKSGTFKEYRAKKGEIRRINPTSFEIRDLVKIQDRVRIYNGGDYNYE